MKAAGRQERHLHQPGGRQRRPSTPAAPASRKASAGRQVDRRPGRPERPDRRRKRHRGRAPGGPDHRRASWPSGRPAPGRPSQAVEQLGKTGTIHIATFDLSPDMLAAIKAGTVDFAIDQQQFLQGYLPIVIPHLLQPLRPAPRRRRPDLHGPRLRHRRQRRPGHGQRGHHPLDRMRDPRPGAGRDGRPPHIGGPPSDDRSDRCAATESAPLRESAPAPVLPAGVRGPHRRHPRSSSSSPSSAEQNGFLRPMRHRRVLQIAAQIGILGRAGRAAHDRRRVRPVAWASMIGLTSIVPGHVDRRSTACRSGGRRGAHLRARAGRRRAQRLAGHPDAACRRSSSPWHRC